MATLSAQFMIDEGIPIPPKHGGGSTRQPKYPFAQMEVGDSFAIPLGDKKVKGTYTSAMRLRSAATNFKRRNDDNTWDFTVRTLVEEGLVRIWRIA